MTTRRIALAYFAVLLVFAWIYYAMPDTDFYHQSIQFEPSSVEHLNRFHGRTGGHHEDTATCTGALRR
jgi:hypothetical protein